MKIENMFEEKVPIEVFLGADGLLRRTLPIGERNDEQETEIISVARCFPWSEPRRWLTIRNSKDEEIALVEDASDLDSVSSHALLSALGEAAFVLKIHRLISVEEEFELRQWNVEIANENGAIRRRFQTKLNAWPRELPGGGVLIQDVANDFYLIEDLQRLDARSSQIIYNYLD